MHSSELGVFRSIISVLATLLGRKDASELNHTPAPMPITKAPAMRGQRKLTLVTTRRQNHDASHSQRLTRGSMHMLCKGQRVWLEAHLL